MTGVPGERRFIMVTVCSTVRFLGQARVQVSMGRPGTNHLDLTGAFAPMEDASNNSNCWTARPSIPQLIGPYDIVAYFEVFKDDNTPGNINLLTQGVMTWEILYTSGKIGALNKTAKNMSPARVLQCSGALSQIDPITGKVSTSICDGVLAASIDGIDIVGVTGTAPPVHFPQVWSRVR